MKAVILAAGKGERLSEITQKIPKPMIEFKGKPLLEHNIELCKKFGIEDIYINLHHLPEKIKDYFGDGKRFGVKIKYSYEEQLLGTAGAVKRIAGDFWKMGKVEQEKRGNGERGKLGGWEDGKIGQWEDDDFFFVLYGDNYSNCDLNLLIDKQKQTNSSCIIAFHYREDVSHSGIAEFNDQLRIMRFIEKPKTGETESHWVNAGIYLMDHSILNYINKKVYDFGLDVFPKLLNDKVPVYGICMYTDVKAFDTPEMYRKVFSKSK